MGGMPGMQVVAEPVATGMQMPGMQMSTVAMPTMSMPEPVPTMTSMPTPVASGVTGHVMSNMPVYAGAPMETQTTQMPMTAPPVYVDQMSTSSPTVYAAPQVGSTSIVGGTVQQEGFVQHAMHTVGNALGLGENQGTTTYVQGGGMTMASVPAGGVTSFGSAQAAPAVTYGAPGTVTTMSTGAYAVGGAGSASLFDQLDTNKDGVISRAEFAQAVQQ